MNRYLCLQDEHLLMRTTAAAQYLCVAVPLPIKQPGPPDDLLADSFIPEPVDRDYSLEVATLMLMDEL